MKVIFLVLLVKCFLIASAVILPEATVAVVNGKAISEDELNKEIGKLLPRTYFHAKMDDDKFKVLKEKTLKELIEKTLLYQYALSKNIVVQKSELKEIIKILENRFGSKAALADAIRQIGHTTKTFENAIMKDEILKKLYKQEIEVNLSEEDLKDYYEKNKFKFKEPEKIKVRLIHVRNDPVDPKGKSKAKKRIDEVLEKLNNGEDFGDIAAKYSDAMSRIKGGDMGWLHRGRLDTAVEEEAFSMDANQTSGIIEKDIGYFIVKVEDKKIPNQLSFERVKKSLKKQLKEKAEKERKLALLDKLKSTAVIIK